MEEPRLTRTGVYRCLMYARFGEHENLYAHPLDFLPVVDANTREVLHIDFPPHRAPGTGKLSSSTTHPNRDLDADAVEKSGRERIPPALTKFDYLPDLLAQKEGGFEMRTDIKPLHVVQPEGVSFKMNGSRIQWQNWDFHIMPHYRDGLVFNTVSKLVQFVNSIVAEDITLFRSLIMTMAKSVLLSTECHSWKWLFLMQLPSSHIPANSHSM
jgi:Cu2+-containing amine oxidase